MGEMAACPSAPLEVAGGSGHDLEYLARVRHGKERLDLGERLVQRSGLRTRTVASLAHDRHAVNPALDAELVRSAVERDAVVCHEELLAVSGPADAKDADAVTGPVHAGTALVFSNLVRISQNARIEGMYVLVGKLKWEAADGMELAPLALGRPKKGIVIEEVRRELQPASGVGHVCVVTAEHRHVVGRALAVEAIVVMMVVEDAFLVAGGEIGEVFVLEQDPQHHQVGIGAILVVGLKGKSLKEHGEFAHELFHDLAVESLGVAILLLGVILEGGMVADAGKWLDPDELVALEYPSATDVGEAAVPAGLVAARFAQGRSPAGRALNCLPLLSRQWAAILAGREFIVVREREAVIDVRYAVQ